MEIESSPETNHILIDISACSSKMLFRDKLMWRTFGLPYSQKIHLILFPIEIFFY